MGWLVERGHEAAHVSTLPNGLQMPDTDIWKHARQSGSILVSKDRDFLELAAVWGIPPRILLITPGNASTPRLLAALADAWPSIIQALEAPTAGVVTLERDHIVALSRT